MADEKVVKVVEGGEVTFTEEPLKADALHVAEEGPVQPELPKDIAKLVVQYLREMDQYFVVRGLCGFSKTPKGEEVAISLAPYVRFDRKLSVHLIPVPRNQVIEVISKEQPDLGRLLQSSDLAETFPDPYDLNMGLPHHFRNLSNQANSGYTGLETARGFFRELQQYTRDMVIIPSEYVLSLFVQEGEVYREFLESVTKERRGRQGPYLELQKKAGRKWARFRPNFNTVEVSIPQIIDFVQQTDRREVTAFLTDLFELNKYLNQQAGKAKTLKRRRKLAILEIPSQIQYNLLVQSMCDTLYQRLHQYHPELTLP